MPENQSFVKLKSWVRRYAAELGMTFSDRQAKRFTIRLIDELDRMAGDPRTWSDPTPEQAFRNLMAAA